MLDMTALRRMVWKPIGLDSDNEVELPRDEIDLLLNRSFWEIQDKFPFREKERIATFSTIPSTARYNLPEPIECLKGLYIIDPDGQHIELDQVETDEFEENANDSEDRQGFPVRYQLINCYAELQPTPNDVWTIVIKRHLLLTDLSDDNPSASIPRVWHEIIGYGALWRAFMDIGDVARSQAIKQIQNSLLNSLEPQHAKEKSVNVRDAGLEVIRNDYSV